MRDLSRSRSRSPHKQSSRRRSRSPRKRSPERRRRSRTRSRSSSPTSLTSQPTIIDSWNIVKNDQTNFDAWMHLLNLVDQYNDIPAARNIYDRFLEKYPFCYGFWKKYADLERRNNNLTDCMKVWERAITEIPLCYELWIGFIAFMKELAPVSEEGIRKVISLYDRAIQIAGIEFNSDRLWNDAIMWHEGRGDWRKVAELYDNVLQTPTAQFKSHFDRYMAIINMYEPDILLGDEEYADIFARARKNLAVGIDMMVTEESSVEGELNPDVDVQPIIKMRKKHHPDVLAFFREEMRERRARWHEKTAIMITCRLHFEEQIKRPYFHVKELEVSQLKNWREYLDFEIGNGDDERTKTLFERCVIACALYDTVWLKYARWIYRVKGSSAARKVYDRARIHCPKSVNLVIAYSALEELKGDHEAALSILNSFDRRNPGYAAISLRKIGVCRRKAAKEKTPDYSDVIQQWETLIHSPGTSRHLSSFYSIKLARFHLKCRKDNRLAEKVVRRALERDRDNIQLHLQLIDLAYTDAEFDQQKVIDAFNDALSSRLDDAERLRLSQRKLDFLEDVGESIEILQSHTEQHQQLLNEIENPHIHTRKRKGERERDRDRDRGNRRDRDGGQQYAGGGAQAVFYQPQQGQMYDYNAAYAFQGQQGYY